MATKLDPAPLVAAAGIGTRPLARRLKVDPSLLCRPLTIDQADRFAAACNLHPAEIWGDTWWAIDT